MKRNLKKNLALGVIALFVVASLAPVVNSQILENEKSKLSYESSHQELIEITVSEYKPDGTLEEKTIKMPIEKAEEIKEKLMEVKDLGERLSIWKEYGLIHKDVTLEKLRKGMEEKAQGMGLTKEKMERIASNRPECYFLNFMCMVKGLFGPTLNIPIGLSLLMGTINFLLFLFDLFGLLPENGYISSIDLLDISIGGAGYVSTWQGILPYNGCMGDRLFIVLLGFVGFYISLPLCSPIFIFIGSSIAAFGGAFDPHP